MLKEFKNFALKGNVMDMAVGVIIGGAFGKIISSIIDDLIMPVVGRLVGNVDFSNLYLPLSLKVKEPWQAGGLALADAKKIGPVFAYGNFITVLVNFLILAFCVFMLVKVMSNLKKKEQTSPVATTKECPFCFSTISLRATKCSFCTSAIA